uniref:Retrotransposon gag domain-containing protein n=1 Tax=Romanomermis culicivorax TaxID=13658 RepID=A0A915IVY7_ROMCU
MFWTRASPQVAFYYIIINYCCWHRPSCSQYKLNSNLIEKANQNPFEPLKTRYGQTTMANNQARLNLVPPAPPDQVDQLDRVQMEYELLVAHVQYPGETVTTFAADLRRLARRALPEWNGAGESDIIIKNHFINRLLPEIRRCVQNAEPDSFETAVMEAEKQELREKQYRGESVQPQQALTSSVNQLSNLVQQLSALNVSRNLSLERGNGPGRNKLKGSLYSQNSSWDNGMLKLMEHLQ